MLLSNLIHPQILGALAAAGHGSKVLIADGNYPLSTATAAGASLVYLGLTPGQILVDDILTAIAGAVAIEALEVMQPGVGDEPPIFSRFREIVPDIELTPLDRAGFYAAARDQNLALAIASGDQRHFANVLLTIGVAPE
ncbi:MAG TPA: RbsD/FucU domain-containing protein [Galbitalea sp.]|jgi:L-fucose mutarotase